MTVFQKQCLLAYLGYYDGQIDGKWGPLTQAATEAFQKDYQLSVDGVYGNGTRDKVVDVIASGEKSIIQQEKENAAAAPDAPADAPADDDALFWESIPNFEKEEFTCHCGCGLNNVDHRLVILCQKVRDHFDAPFLISSPCRCKKNNDRLPNSAPNSRHLYGRAVDFGIRGHSDGEVKRYLDTLPEVAYSYIMDSGNVHMDII